MAFVKVKVDALEQQKKEYEKAIKSLDGALEQIMVYDLAIYSLDGAFEQF